MNLPSITLPNTSRMITLAGTSTCGTPSRMASLGQIGGISERQPADERHVSGLVDAFRQAPTQSPLPLRLTEHATYGDSGEPVASGMVAETAPLMPLGGPFLIPKGARGNGIGPVEGGSGADLVPGRPRRERFRPLIRSASHRRLPCHRDPLRPMQGVDRGVGLCRHV